MWNKIGYKLLSILLLWTCIQTLTAQEMAHPLDNTYWRVSLEGGRSNSIIGHFSKDTLYYANDLEEPFIAHSTFSLTGDSLQIQSLSASISCESEMIGVYQIEFVFSDLLMKFNLLSDECTERGKEFPELDFIRFGFSPVFEPKDNVDSLYKVLPNPNPDGLYEYENTVQTHTSVPFEILKIDGSSFFSGSIRNIGDFDISSVRNGVYYLSTYRWKKWRTIRLLKFDEQSDQIQNSEQYSIVSNTSVEGLFSYEYKGIDSHANYHVFDAQTNLIQSDYIYEEGTIDLSEAPDGVYFLLLKDYKDWEVWKIFKLDFEENNPTDNRDYNIVSTTVDGLFSYQYLGSDFRAKYSLYTSEGQLLQNGEVGIEGTIDISTQAEGRYFVVFQDQTGWYPYILYKLDATTSISPPSISEHLTIFPNPSSDGIFNYNYTGTDDQALYSIYDVSGKRIQPPNPVLPQGTINLSLATTNIFYFVFEDEAGWYSYKLVR